MTRLLFVLLLTLPLLAQQSPVLAVSGTGFLLDGKPFYYSGLSFFNAIYNPEFNRDSDTRRTWLRKFRRYGITVLRVWAQWDSKRGFVNASPEATLYQQDGALRPAPLSKLKEIVRDAASEGMVIQLVLFSQESWRENIRVTGAAADQAVAQLTRELQSFRNLYFQIWNEFDDRTLDHVRTIKSIDPARLVTNSPGIAGVLTGMRGEEQALDFLTPHTSRQDAGKTWEIAPREIAYLLARFGKPVVDDEPARNGTAQFGGPKAPTSPYDHVLQIIRVRQAGGHTTYHHDMFQTGAGSPAVPPSGIPDPEFSSYHRAVFDFLASAPRYFH